MSCLHTASQLQSSPRAAQRAAQPAARAATKDSGPSLLGGQHAPVKCELAKIKNARRTSRAAQSIAPPPAQPAAPPAARPAAQPAAQTISGSVKPFLRCDALRSNENKEKPSAESLARVAQPAVKPAAHCPRNAAALPPARPQFTPQFATQLAASHKPLCKGLCSQQRPLRLTLAPDAAPAEQRAAPKTAKPKSYQSCLQ